MYLLFGFNAVEEKCGLKSAAEKARYGGIKVGWKKIQRNIGHFLVLVEYISIALSYK